MEMTKIEKRRVQLRGYSNAIAEIEGRMDFELDYFVNSTDNGISEEQRQKALIRCDVYHAIIRAIEKMALPEGERDY